MESKKINQLATEMSPASSDLTIIGDPITGVSKKVTLLQIADIFQTTGTVTSVGVTETGNALTITGSPITSAGNINIGFAGSASQYVRGDGALADFPTSTGGGSSVSYYLNSSVSQGTIGGNAYRQLSKSPVIGAGTDIAISANGYIANYITDANDPSLLEVPGGNFNCELYFSVNSNNHNPYVYAELYKYDGTNFTLLGSSQAIPEYLTAGTTLSSYYFAIPVATAALTITDRLAIRIYVNVDTRVVTLHTENNHLCQVVTTFSKGLTSLNNLTRQVQYFGIGTSGTDFNISSSTATHTFNLPTASATNRGALSSTDWSTFNNKQNALTNPITGTGTSGQVSYFNGTSSLTGNNNFFWDTTNSRLGIGLNNPQRVLEIYSATADSHLRLSGAAPTVSMGEAITGSVYQAKFGLVTANGQFYTGAVAGDFVIISQTGSTIWGNSGGERMRLNTNGTFSIGNTNNTFNLDVTGTGRFTGQLTLGSTITNGTYTYTLPSATGTLALTSDLSSYVLTSRTVSTTSPLSGGGALSSDLTLSISQASGSANGYLSSTDWTTFNNKQTQINGTGFVKASGTTISYDNSTYLTTSSASSTYLPLAGGTLIGALNGTSATFSGAIQINTNVAGLILNRSAVTNYNGISYLTNGVGQWFVGMRENLSSNNYIIYNESGTDALTISKSTNAATFSSSVTAATNFIAQSSTTNSLRFLFENSFNKGGVSIDYTTGEFRLYAGESGNGYYQTFFTQGSERMRISSTGNVGIGTTSPTSSLHVGTATSGNQKIQHWGEPGFVDNYGLILRGSSLDGVFKFYGLNNGTETTNPILSMNRSSGNVGIGTAAPTTGRIQIQTSGNGTSYSHPYYSYDSSVYQNSFLISHTDGITRLMSSWNATGIDSNMTFWTTTAAGSQSERMRITATGNVGIGTTAPSSFANGGLTLGTATLGKSLILNSSSDGNNGLIQFVDRNSANSFQIAGSAVDIILYGYGSKPMIFYTNDTERMRITSGGDLCINATATSGSAKLYVNGVAVFGSVQVGSLGTGTVYSSSGTLTNTNPSDKRLKENITPITYGLSEILKLNPVSFDWKNDNNKNKQFGFIAQEVQEVMPEAVIDGEYLGLEKDAIYTALINAIKELEARLKTLENK